MFGMWLDYMLDRARVALCSLALMTGQFLKTGEPLYIYLAFLIVLLDMTRYMNALHIFKIRSKMNKEVRKTIRQIYGATQQEHSEEREEPVGERNSRVVDLNQHFKSRFGFYLRVRDWLEKYRIGPTCSAGSSIKCSFHHQPLSDESWRWSSSARFCFSSSTRHPV